MNVQLLAHTPEPEKLITTAAKLCYGDSFGRSFIEYGMTMPCIRLEDKLQRVKNLVRNGSAAVKDESIDDTLLDLANYAIMTLIERGYGE